MMILKELLALNEAKVPKSIKGWLAMSDPDGNTTNVEAVYVFGDESNADAFQAGLDDEIDGSDSFSEQMTVGDFYIVFQCDHKVDPEELSPIMFDTSKPNLMKRLKTEIEAGNIYGVESFDQVEDEVVFLKTS